MSRLVRFTIGDGFLVLMAYCSFHLAVLRILALVVDLLKINCFCEIV